MRDPPQQLDTASHIRAYGIPCGLMELAACCFQNSQLPRRYRFQVHNPHLLSNTSATTQPAFWNILAWDRRTTTFSAEPRAVDAYYTGPLEGGNVITC